MSEENAIRFLHQIEEDPNLKDKVRSLSNKEELVYLGQEMGYSFTAEEMKSVGEKISSDELSDQELEAVAGGGLWSWAKSVGSATVALVRDVLD